MGQLIKYFCQINGLYLDYQKRFKTNYIKSVVNHFPYIPQNPRTDRPVADRSSMPLQISAGAGAEAVIFGLFGITSHKDGSIDFAPVYNYEIGGRGTNSMAILMMSSWKRTISRAIEMVSLLGRRCMERKFRFKTNIASDIWK